MYNLCNKFCKEISDHKIYSSKNFHMNSTYFWYKIPGPFRYKGREMQINFCYSSVSICVCLCLKGRLSNQELVHEDPQTPVVHTLIMKLSLNHLRRKVVQGPTKCGTSLNEMIKCSEKMFFSYCKTWNEVSNHFRQGNNEGHILSVDILLIFNREKNSQILLKD